jgi:hypothetical protein
MFQRLRSQGFCAFLCNFPKRLTGNFLKLTGNFIL